MEKIARAYVAILGPLNVYKAKAIEEAMRAGLDVGAVLDAIEQTALAPRPSHSYLVAILRRYAAQGVTTAQAAKADRQRFAIKRSAAGREGAAWYDRPSGRNPALDYTQREYKDEDFADFFIDLDKYGE